MSDFAGMEDLLQDFLVEAGDLLSGVDNKLVDLERAPGDKGLLNDIFRGFHTIKGGAGFLNATELVSLCHLTENLFDKLRNGELEITPEVMDVILFSTAAVRDMFDSLEQGTQPAPADPSLMDKLRDALAGELGHGDTHVERMPPVVEAPAPAPAPAAPAPAAAPVMVASPVSVTDDGPDWDSLFEAVTGTPVFVEDKDLDKFRAAVDGNGFRASELGRYQTLASHGSGLRFARVGATKADWQAAFATRDLTPIMTTVFWFGISKP